MTDTEELKAILTDHPDLYALVLSLVVERVLLSDPPATETQKAG